MALVEPLPPARPYGYIHTSRQNSWSAFGIPSLLSNRPASRRADGFEEVDLVSELDGFRGNGIDALAARDSIDTVSLSLNDVRGSQIQADPSSTTSKNHPSRNQKDTPGNPQLEPKGPFHRWMRTLHRRASQRPTILHDEGNDAPWQLQDSDFNNDHSLSRKSGHQKSSSGSSFGFVSAVRSASVSLASASVVTRSRRNKTRSHGLSRTDRSSRASMSAPRVSEDSTTVDRPAALDAGAIQRSLQRRRILEELIGTEESYIGDVRFLMNVYVTILASLPTLPVSLRSSINRNLNDIVELHEEILGELHRVIPHSEYTQFDLRPTQTKPGYHGYGHRRGWSLDAVPEDSNDATWLHNVPGMVSDPQVAAEVSKVFAKQMNRFFVYSEYGAKYELMIRDIASAHETMPDWEMYQKGLEALASTLGSVKSNEGKLKKSLTIGDLLVKPVQRICKYPLLFAELLKFTPVSDCPNSHMEVENALMRIREATAEINRATNDSCMKATLERTWLLQDRLIFPNRRLDATSRSQIRSFGHIRLCGALHICWQSTERVEGQYMICLLYHNILCLASAGKVEPIYAIQACINLDNARIDDVDNGRGMQCHTAPFSWKLVFEVDHQLYEIIMTACTSREEEEWRLQLSQSAGHDDGSKDPNLYSSLLLDMKSLGIVFGRPGTMARRISIHRATTVGPKSQSCQVVLKNTSVIRDGASSTSPPMTINRSQSLLTTHPRFPVLAPARSERARLEALLADVWSRDVLPFPGMVSTRSRSEHIVRSSASTVMRKLSVTSIASSFNKRSSSLTRKAMSADEVGAGGEVMASRSESKSVNDEIVCDEGLDLEKMEMMDEPMVHEIREDIAFPPSIELPDFELKEVCGTVRTLRATAPGPKITEDNAGVSMLRTSSTHSLRLASSRRSGVSGALSIRKENACQAPNGKVRNYNRWARVGGIRSDGKGHGFRSLFR